MKLTEEQKMTVLNEVYRYLQSDCYDFTVKVGDFAICTTDKLDKLRDLVRRMIRPTETAYELARCGRPDTFIAAVRPDVAQKTNAGLEVMLKDYEHLLTEARVALGEGMNQ